MSTLVRSVSWLLIGLSEVCLRRMFRSGLDPVLILVMVMVGRSRPVSEGWGAQWEILLLGSSKSLLYAFSPCLLGCVDLEV